MTTALLCVIVVMLALIYRALLVIARNQVQADRNQRRRA